MQLTYESYPLSVISTDFQLLIKQANMVHIQANMFLGKNVLSGEKL